MTKISSNGDITHTRGDTALIRLHITNNGEPYESQDDTFTFTVKHNVHDTQVVIQKIFHEPRIILQTHDTSSMDAGTYVYDVQVRTAAGVVQTIGPHKFILKADVTR